ncbi:MAG: PIN domain-containing protein [Nanoarchaeota archaeon]
MGEVKKCLDTYALVEIASGNPAFKEYLKYQIVITDITMAEWFFVILREEGEAVANYWYEKMEQYCSSVNREILIEAVKFRHKNKKSNISFFDAVGYIFALKNNYHFVTGDKEFENLANVDFKKK